MPLTPTSLGFKKFLLHETGWHTAWNDNADLIDSLLTGSTPLGSPVEVRGAAGAAGVLDLTTAELTVVDGDKLGQINFRAPLESSASDAILNGASIYAEADAVFTASVNSTDLVIALGTSEAAAEMARFTHEGRLGIGIATPDGTLHVHTATAGSVAASVYSDDLVVENSTHGGISILTPNNVVGAIYFGDPESNESGSVQYDHTPNALFFSTAAAERMRLTLGLVIGSPTDLDKGAGTLNAVHVYDDGTALTDYVFEPGYDLMPLADMESFFRTHNHLPTIQGKAEWDAAGGFSLGHLSTMLWETAEVHALYIADLHARVAKLEE
jgi:hypothetical protein